MSPEIARKQPPLARTIRRAHSCHGTTHIKLQNNQHDLVTSDNDLGTRWIAIDKEPFEFELKEHRMSRETNSEQNSKTDQSIQHPRKHSDTQFEQIAKDQQELQRMLDSVNDLDNTSGAELATMWQSINDREIAIREQNESLNAYRSQVDREAQELEQQRREFDMQQQALASREAVSDSPDHSRRTPNDMLSHDGQHSRLADWEAKLNSREHQLHDRHAALDQQSRLAVLQKANLRAERDELAVLREQLQLAAGHGKIFAQGQIVLQGDSNEQQQLAAEWHRLRTSQAELEREREDVDRQRREIDRHLSEVESRVMPTHEPSSFAQPSSQMQFPVDNDLDATATTDWRLRFANDTIPRDADSAADASNSPADGIHESTPQSNVGISLNALFSNDELDNTGSELQTSSDDSSGAHDPSEESLAENTSAASDQVMEAEPPLLDVDTELNVDAEPTSGGTTRNQASTSSSETETASELLQPDSAVPASTESSDEYATENNASQGEMEEESIEKYMERLLSQSRSMTKTARRQEQQSPATDQNPSPSEQRETRPDPAPQPEPESTANNPQVSNAPVHSQNREEVRAGLDSLRELANYSARSAIVSHTWRKHRTSILTKLSLLILAFSMIVGLSVFQILPHTQTLITRCALSAIVVAALYALMPPIQSLQALWQDRDRAFRNVDL